MNSANGIAMDGLFDPNERPAPQLWHGRGIHAGQQMLAPVDGAFCPGFIPGAYGHDDSMVTFYYRDPDPHGWQSLNDTVAADLCSGTASSNQSCYAAVKPAIAWSDVDKDNLSDESCFAPSVHDRRDMIPQMCIGEPPLKDDQRMIESRERVLSLLGPRPSIPVQPRFDGESYRSLIRIPTVVQPTRLRSVNVG